MDVIHVGVGGFGNTWFKLLAGSDKVNLVGLVDVNKATLDQALTELGAHASVGAYASLEEALAATHADMLVCSSPPQYHRAHAVAAMEAGLNVICEKPMAGSPADCAAMLETAEQTGRHCAISQNYRYRPSTQTLARLVAENEIGEIGQVRIDFYKGHDFGGGFRHDMEYPLLVDMAIHHFDLIRFITGQDAVAVRGEAWNPAWSNYKGDCSCSILFEMSNGARIVYDASWCAKGQFCDWNGNWQIEGTKGTLTYNNGRITLTRAANLYTVTDTLELEQDACAEEGQQRVLSDMLQAINTGSQPATNVRDNANSVAMVFAAVEAVRNGKRIRVTAPSVSRTSTRSITRSNPS